LLAPSIRSENKQTNTHYLAENPFQFRPLFTLHNNFHKMLFPCACNTDSPPNSRSFHFSTHLRLIHTHTPCRSHAEPMPFPAMPCR
jgi:hypothetical protein